MDKTIIPQIKKRLSSFIVDERGKISKQSIVTLGATLLTVAGLANAGHSNHSQNLSHGDSSSLSYASNVITATHIHYDPPHSNHSSHSSHGSMCDSG